MRKLILLGLFAIIAVSACAGAIPDGEGPDQASDVSILVYKSPT